MQKISEVDKAKLYELEEIIGYSFRDISHLYKALVHKSYVNEVADIDIEDNERYEFMGDAIIEFIITEYLFTKYPDESEGVLTLMRSYIVDSDNCAAIARELRLAEYVFLGRGERTQGRGTKRSILANAFEALVCAVYLDGGIKKCRNFVIYTVEKYTPNIEKKASQNFKAELQNYVQKKYQHVPSYRDISAVGPDHEKTFEVSVSIKGVIYGKGKGASKKIAQQNAAKIALAKISEKEGLDGE